VTIHGSDPFATPDAERSPVRRLRGRLPAPVTLWTAGTASARAGLTVSSVLVVDGEPGRLIGVLDEESELWAALASTGRVAVVPLGPADGQLADRFAGLMPAPGGRFAGAGGGRGPSWRDTEFGPVPDMLGDGSVPTWAGATLDGARPYGWGLLVEATIAQVTLGEAAGGALAHLRGRYHPLGVQP
jgi:hypothetical protein